MWMNEGAIEAGQKEEAGVNRWIDPGLGRGRLPTLPLSQYHRRGGV